MMSWDLQVWGLSCIVVSLLSLGLPCLQHGQKQNKHALPNVMMPAAFYNIDAGRKMSLSTSVEVSPLRYSIIRSQAPRFGDDTKDVPFGAYTVDTGSKKSLESYVRDNRRFYSSAFQSKTPRFGRPLSSPTETELGYAEPLITKNSAPSTFSQSVETSNIKYSILRSRYRRFPDKPVMGNGPDITYNTDAYPRTTLYTSVQQSPITYKCATGMRMSLDGLHGAVQGGAACMLPRWAGHD